MSSFDKTWKRFKSNNDKSKSRKRKASLDKSRTRDRSAKRRRTKTYGGNYKRVFTPQNVPLWIGKWNSKGGYSYWKDHFPKWQRWCESALGLDRSNVSQPKSERALIDRFSKPERYMKHRKMGLKELREEGQGWDEFLLERMAIEKTPFVEIRDPMTDAVLYTASIPKSSRRELRDKSGNDGDDPQSKTRTTPSKSKQRTSTSDVTQIDTESDEPESSSEDFEPESEQSDSDVQVMSNRNNSNNQNQSRRSKPYMKGSITSVDDAMEDFSRATGRDIKNGANDNQVFDVEGVMVSALKKAKMQRSKEIKAAKQKEKDQFSEMMDTILDKGLKIFVNGTLDSQVFAMSVGTSLEVCFFQWCYAKLDELMDHYNGDINMDSFHNKVSELIKQPIKWNIFLKQWMFWRIMSGDDTGMILTRIECFQIQDDLLPPALISDNNQFMTDLNTNIENINGIELDTNSNVAVVNVTQDITQNQSKKNGKAEIDDDDDE